MTPFGIYQKGQVQIVDPLSPEVVELMQRRKPYYLNVPLVWDAPRAIGNLTQNTTPERKMNLLLMGARSALNYSTLRIKNETTDFYYMNDFTPFYAVTGGSGSDRQLWDWRSWIYLPANTVLVIDAVLGPTAPGGNTPEEDGEIIFDAIWLT